MVLNDKIVVIHGHMYWYLGILQPKNFDAHKIRQFEKICRQLIVFKKVLPSYEAEA